MVFVISPQIRDWQSKQQTLKSITQQAEGPLITNTSGFSTQDQQAFQKKYQQITALLPSSDQQYDLAVQIEALTRSLGLPLSSLSMSSAGTALAGSGASTVTVTLTTKGQYATLRQLIVGITRLERFTQITQTTFTVGTADASGVVNLQIVAQAYYIPVTK